MKAKKVLVHASLALCAMIVLSCLVAGCDKKSTVDDVGKEAVYPAEGHAYMKDPEFQKVLKKQQAEKNSILAEREEIFSAFAALEKRAGSRAAAEKLPEWKSLEARAKACGEHFEANRRATGDLFVERLKRAQADSERIKRGEARKISK